jgi:hypothetical protein
VGEGAPHDAAEVEEEESFAQWQEPAEEEMPVVAAGRRLDLVAISSPLLVLM